MILEHVSLIIQEANFGEPDLAEIFSLGTGFFAFILFTISLIAYRRVKLTRFLLVSAAFAVFAVKTLPQNIDLIFPTLDIGATVSTLLVFLDFLVLLLIFLALDR